MKKIIFVCTGNTCRSPMIEQILKHKLKLNNIKGVTVTSAGIMADPNTYTNTNTIKALENMGIHYENMYRKIVMQKSGNKDGFCQK